MSQNQALQILVNEDSALGKRKTTSTKVKGLVLALEGFGGASESSIKKAVEKIKVSPMDHLSSYSLLHPYFEKWKLQDPSLRYDIEPKTDGVFHRLLVLMPNTVAFLPNLLNVFALDAGHMVEMRFKGIKENILRDILGENHAVLPGREYIMDKLTLSVVTGLTLNHSRMLLGYCLGYGENHDDEKAFLQFMVENGCSVMNSPSTVFMSDRGATSSPIDDILPLAIHHFCPKHLERNLQDLKYDVKVQKKFWAARCAKDALTYEKRMQELEKESAKAAAYLRPIPNWQLYKVLEKGGILHELKSDNLVEGMFSSLRLARQARSPVFVANEITMTALKIQRYAQVLAEESASDVTPRALKLLTTNFIEAEQFCVEVASNHQAVVRFAGACRKRSPGCNVNLKKKKCECQVWAQTGAPCVHAAAFILKMFGNSYNSEHFYEF